MRAARRAPRRRRPPSRTNARAGGTRCVAIRTTAREVRARAIDRRREVGRRARAIDREPIDRASTARDDDAAGARDDDDDDDGDGDAARDGTDARDAARDATRARDAARDDGDASGRDADDDADDDVARRDGRDAAR